MWRLLILLAACWASGSYAAAPQSRAVSIVSMGGSCRRLVLDGHDFSNACQPRVANVEFSDGRVTFTYAAGEDFTVTFSGDGRKQIHRGPDTAIQPIDLIYSSIAGATSKPSRVVGSCEFSNPYKGPSAINCSAESGTGREVAEFTTDGRPPNPMPLR
jgi:hypothetical protein